VSGEGGDKNSSRLVMGRFRRLSGGSFARKVERNLFESPHLGGGEKPFCRGGKEVLANGKKKGGGHRIHVR